MSASSWVHLDVEEILRETDKAFLIRLEDGGEEAWVPKSCISDVDDYEVGDAGLSLAISEWFAKQKGWE